jgi:hypothetical protein
MVRPERLELPAYWFEASRSIQLSYGRTLRLIILCREIRAFAIARRSRRAFSWGSQSWLPTAFSRRVGDNTVPEPPGKAAAGKIACPTYNISS